MIVRILGEAQYEIDDDTIGQLTELDAVVDRALAAGDEAAFKTSLTALTAMVREKGKHLDAATILPSDLVLPPEDTSLSEVHDLLASEEVDS